MERSAGCAHAALGVENPSVEHHTFFGGRTWNDRLRARHPACRNPRVEHRSEYGSDRALRIDSHTRFAFVLAFDGILLSFNSALSTVFH